MVELPIVAFVTPPNTLSDRRPPLIFLARSRKDQLGIRAYLDLDVMIYI
jgi:hypothetical protein